MTGEPTSDRAVESFLGPGDDALRFPVDLKAAPFHLDESAAEWVEKTIASMTLEEKIGQLFINHNNDYSPAYLDNVLENFHVGGMRYRPGPSSAVQEHIRYAQSRTRIPLLVASNPEMGGAGSCDDGTFVSTHLQAGSHPDKSIARRMGEVAGVDERDQHVRARVPRNDRAWRAVDHGGTHRRTRGVTALPSGDAGLGDPSGDAGSRTASGPPAR
ncbi:hypothetical protein ACIPY2_10110 [Paenarthrobacter sp. NPDC089675]|uniref:hypothetical protein n=1 Tax=Paenarthrobacter sp. NPDC089675 TaxID=3364376 RepID=UPI003826D8F0